MHAMKFGDTKGIIKTHHTQTSSEVGLPSLSLTERSSVINYYLSDVDFMLSVVLPRTDRLTAVDKRLSI